MLMELATLLLDEVLVVVGWWMTAGDTMCFRHDDAKGINDIQSIPTRTTVVKSYIIKII